MTAAAAWVGELLAQRQPGTRAASRAAHVHRRERPVPPGETSGADHGSPTDAARRRRTRWRTSSPRSRCGRRCTPWTRRGRGHRGHPRRRPWRVVVQLRLLRETTSSSIAAAADEATQARIAVLLLPGIGTMDDLRQAREAGASVARIATHCTEADVSLQHFGAARDLGMETVGFLMLAHRIGPDELARQARIMVDAGAQCVYVRRLRRARWYSATPRNGSQALVAEIGTRRPGRLPRPPEPLPRRGQLGARRSRTAPCRSTARCAPSARARATPPPRSSPRRSTSWASTPALTSAPRSRRPRRSSGRSCPGCRGRTAPDHAGLRRGLLELPAARRARSGALRRPGARDPASASASMATSAARRT